MADNQSVAVVVCTIIKQGCRVWCVEVKVKGCLGMRLADCSVGVVRASGLGVSRFGSKVRGSTWDSGFKALLLFCFGLPT